MIIQINIYKMYLFAKSETYIPNHHMANHLNAFCSNRIFKIDLN